MNARAEAPTCLKEAGRRSVWLRRDREGQPIVVKTWPLGPLTLVKLVIGVSQPQRHRRGARRTAAAGIDTPAVSHGPRLVVRAGRPLLELTHPYVAGDDAYELLRRSELSPAQRSVVARGCGRIVARYAAAGLLHRDLKLSNLVIAPSRDRIWVIDTLGVRHARDAVEATARMLERLEVQLREDGVDVGRSAKAAVMRAALNGRDRSARRAVVRRLRARPAR